MNFDDLDLYDVQTNELIATIPAGTEIKEFYEGNIYQKMYVTYNNAFGYINNLKNGKYYLPYGYKSENNYIKTTENTNIMINITCS